MLTIKQIAKELTVSEVSVRNWINKGLLKAYKLDREYRVKKEDYEADMGMVKEAVTWRDL